MRRAFAILALFVSAACCPACTSEGANTNANRSTPVKTDQITVEYPNLFLPGDKGDRGKVTFEIEEVAGRVLPLTIKNGNTTLRIDHPNINIRPDDPDRYNTYVEVQLLTNGLTIVDSSDLKRLYRGDREVWVWSLVPSEGMREGAEVSFRFRVNVTREAKTHDVLTEEIPDVWPISPLTARVGPPAALVDGALYSSPLFAAGGVLTFGVSLRRRKWLPGAEVEGAGGEDAPAPAVDAPKPAVGAPAAPAVVAAELEEEVDSTVYAPGQAVPGDSFLVQVFVHLPEQAASLGDIAQEADEDAKRRITNKLQKKIKRGAELTFYLQMPGLDVDAPAQSCVWDGEPAWVQFGVTVPEGCKPRNVICTVTVSENSVPIGHLKFKFKVAGDASEARAQSSEPVPAGQLTRYRQAFISYASKDRPEVLKRVQMLNLAKIKFFQDLLTLEPGDAWEKVLYEYIDKSDVIFLFWSKAASESVWVRREIEYAVKTKSDGGEPRPEIIPVIIEGPPPASPPAELSFLHFNDKLLYFINTRESGAKSLDA